MSRTYRRNEDGRLRPEQPLPERDRLEPPADFVPYSVCIMEPLSEITLARTPYLDGPTARAYATIERQAQANCGHLILSPQRFGDTLCGDCGLWLWSPYWVADGLYGLKSMIDDDALDGTGLWIEATERDWIKRVMERA